MDEEYFDESKLFATFDSAEDVEKNAICSKRKRKTSADSTELDVLKQENKLLKKVLRRIAPASCQGDDCPVASIVYFDRRFSHGKPAAIDELIKQFAKEKVQSQAQTLADDKCESHNGESFVRKRSSFCDGFALALGKCTNVTDREEDECLDYEISGVPVGSVQYFDSYCLDSFGSTVPDLSPQEPTYEQVYFNVLPHNGQGQRQSRRPKSMCFNCDGDHKLQDCKKPRDLARISTKRQEFRAKFSSPFSQEARYHADKEKQEKFKHLEPGKISKDLSKALGLASHDLPPFIYRMRLLGYPPGWLPTNHDSGIVIHGKEGKAEGGNGEGKNLDLDKFVRFPGFNVFVPEGTKDLAHEVRLPLINAKHQLPIHRDVEGTSRRHRHSSDEVDYDRDLKRRRTSTTDMDIDTEDGVIANNNIAVMSPSDMAWSPACGTHSPTLPLTVPDHTSTPVSTPVSTRGNDLEDGEIPDSPPLQTRHENSRRPIKASINAEELKPSWWLEEALVPSGIKGDSELVPPPFPLRPLPLHKISQILPGEMNHISFEDRNLWLDPIFGNLQIRTGRYDRLKTILAGREKKKI